jgi:tRNA G18 (ribose-2'-O)-methylase SpoU
MFHVEKISALDRPELAPYRTMRRSAEHEAQGIFIAEGDKVVRRLLESRFETVSVLLPEKQLDAFRPLLDARPENLAVYLADRNLLETLIGFVFYQGVLAVGKIPPPASLGEILRNSPAPQLLVAIDEVSNAENIGALARNCVAFGASGLIVGETSSSPFLRRAVRNSMGAVFQLPVVELKRRRGPRESENELRSRGIPPAEKNPTLAETLRELRARGIRCIAAHPHIEGWSSSFSLSPSALPPVHDKLKLELQRKTISQADFSGDCCVVFGSEGNGISKNVLESCDEAVAIPMSPLVDSLNVGAAAAIFLYEAQRQRSGTGVSPVRLSND